jgi:hypothetical protein
MAKTANKSVISLSEKNLSFFIDNGIIAKLVNFNPKDMNVEVNIFEDGKNVIKRKYPFAHLPKNLKKILNPI